MCAMIYWVILWWNGDWMNSIQQQQMRIIQQQAAIWLKNPHLFTFALTITVSAGYSITNVLLTAFLIHNVRLSNAIAAHLLGTAMHARCNQTAIEFISISYT